MSLVFSNSSLKSGIVELIDDIVKTNSSTYPLANKVRDINLAIDKAYSIIFKAAGTWNFDDANFTDYPIISTNLVSGQRDYSFVKDASGNVILDIYKVLVANSAGVYSEIAPYDVQSQDTIKTFTDGANTGGIPTKYDKTANGIFLDFVPNYNYANGLKVYINREGSYFTAADTTKMPGFAGLFHRYLALEAAYQYAVRNSLPVAGGMLRGGVRTGLASQIYEMEQQIDTYYSQRERDINRRMIPSSANNM